MANPEHVELIKQGVEIWNAWRREHPDIRPDLSEANLFELCRPEGLLYEDTHLSGVNFSKTRLYKTNLSSTDLSSANLDEAIIYEANLAESYLEDASLHEANLSDTHLFRTCFLGADLSEADLSLADLFEANLSGADLSSANLEGATLYQTNLFNADFSGAIVGTTRFINLDLRDVYGLETLHHLYPSTVGTNTLERSQGDIPRAFLRGAGLSDTLIEYLPSLFTTSIQYRSLFLSYSHQDQPFAKYLHNSLQDKGVRCWFAPHDLRPGTPIIRGIDEAIHLHDKFLLILSKHAMRSHWVQQEVEAALYREVTTGDAILFPLRLDNTVLESKTLWAKRLRSRHIADFTNWQDETAYQQAFASLLQHLKPTTPPMPRNSTPNAGQTFTLSRELAKALWDQRRSEWNDILQAPETD